MTTNLQSTSLSSYLYEQDYCSWLETTAKLLRNHQLDHVDFEHLIEEIEDMGKEKRRELKNRLIVLLMHLLKYQYQPKKRSSSWVRTIWEQFYQIESLLEDSPSLKPYYLEIFSDCYLKAVRAANTETKLPIDSFPTESSFLPDDLTNPDFITMQLSS
ncbi:MULTISPECIES: DUF29 domain-containing protein [Nostocales]|uniref:DUF29 domain-containing protein n=1 Tax=Nostocales TaxID=1161 RepID=UPI00029B69CB|nr:MULTISPECIES: DUF29 domain-containing protein [Nostocales]AFW95397.1 hypothetical protein ANA_C12685 [Anabaena sp. 90]MTJ16899.1 DUF29 domain-containing protein [Dolichospermum sp. UHCC 0299]MTJ23910.1 DUF29 domain-containing protein [Dolichospermum sp. UHCC 0352]MTJ41058.1 DUF29 domain-containing protein [Dolichospermum sp. UHCC 0406]